MSGLHATTVIAPDSIPHNAAFELMLRLKRERITTGPNAAPKPAQAYETNPITFELGSCAITIAMTEMSNTIKRPTQTNSVLEAFLRKKPL